MSVIENISAKIEKLPDHVKPELYDFVEFLLAKYGEKEKNDAGFRFDWEGMLSDFKPEYSSVELQHKAMEWR